MKHYEHSYPATDIVLLEPDHRDTAMFLANTFSYRQRRQMAEHAYQSTRHMLRSRKSTLPAQLAQHGITFNMALLDDPKRQLVAPLPAATRLGRALASLEEIMDDLNHAVKPQTLLAGHS